MTKHVDSKLLAEHVRCIGCEFAAGRADVVPQVFQDIDDVVELVEDVPSGLMTASACQRTSIRIFIQHKYFVVWAISFEGKVFVLVPSFPIARAYT